MLAQSAALAYRIVDNEAAIFSGAPGARTLAPGVAALLAGAEAVALDGTLSAQEYGLLSAVPGFDIGALQGDIDLVAPLAGTLGFGGLGLADPQQNTVLTNRTGFTLELSGAEQGAHVAYQVVGGSDAGWATLPSPTLSGLAAGSYTYRAVITDAAGNAGPVASRAIVYDNVAPQAGMLALPA